MPHRARLIDLASITEKQLENFHSKIDRSGDGCWPWVITRTRKGRRPPKTYGTFIIGSKEKGTRRSVATHRLAFQLAHPDELLGPYDCVCHQCDWPPCCRISHLFRGSNLANILDREKKGRGNHPQGEHHGRAKLTESDVREIRASDEYLRILAARFGVSLDAIFRVKRRLTWKHVT